MKKIYAALCAIITILTTSCSIDFVTPVHNSSEPMEEYFNTEARMFESLVAAYDPLQWFDYFYQYDALPLISDIMGDHRLPQHDLDHLLFRYKPREYIASVR